MQKAIYHRKEIPFFYDKSTDEFANDPYEQYRIMVVRQTAVHLADQLWGIYPFDSILKWVDEQIITAPETIIDIGCGVGRLIGTLAVEYPNAYCWGVDYSYQMLKRANEYWIANKQIELDWRERGFPLLDLAGKSCKNLQFGLSKAEDLPFDSASIPCVVSSFLFDRLEQAAKMLEEVQRILVPDGQFLLITPLNFQKIEHWQAYYPVSKLRDLFKSKGYVVQSITKPNQKLKDTLGYEFLHPDSMDF